MGIYIEVQVWPEMVIKKGNREVAREIALDHLTGDGWESPMQFFSWITEGIENRKKYQQDIGISNLLAMLGWEVRTDKDYNLVISEYSGEKYHSELFEDLFRKLAPVIEDGAQVIIATGAFDAWGWFFQGGKVLMDDMELVPAISKKNWQDKIDHWNEVAESKR